MIQTKLYKQIFVATALVLVASNAFAFKPFRAKSISQVQQPVFQLPAAPNATSAPFDGGITLLIAAGIGYASKKGYDKRRKQKEARNNAQ